MTMMQSSQPRPSPSAAASTSTTARFSPRSESDRQRGPRVKVLVGGVAGRELDLTGNLTGAIAHALWESRGGDSVSNWTEAERILELLGGITQPRSIPLGTTSSGVSPHDSVRQERPSMPEVTIPGKRKGNRR